MLDRLVLMAFFGGTVASVYGLSMLSTPRKGFTKVLERIGAGAVLCLVCYALLSPFGLSIPQGPISALCAGYLGLPGVALSTFVSLWP